jgi:hypothetical protein
MKSRDPQRAIAMAAAREFDRVVSYLRSGRPEDALRVAIYAADRARRDLRARPRKAQNSGLPAAPLPSS